MSDDVHPSSLTDVVALLKAERDEARAEVERLRQRAEAAEAQVKAWQEDWREGRRELLAWAKEEP